jgi:NADH-quinone oxidoreductase subunit L
MFDRPENLAWLILLLPLFSAVAITLFTSKLSKLSARISIAAVVGSFILSLVFFVLLGQTETIQVPSINWLNVGAGPGSLSVELGLKVDHLSLLMMLIVTGVGSLIHIYSYGYMDGDRSFSRYFASLSLFTFSMLGIVLANNFFQMFIFWELVGISSYLLIGFWYEKPSAAEAAKKAFLTNRIGDFGFLLGIIIIWALVGSVQFDHIQQRLATNPGALGVYSTLAGLLIFCGAMGKSAQFPLHVWLPDAMEGPTPVSALIHAATMVAAGVYMLCRAFFVFQAVPAAPEWFPWLQGVSALHVIAWIGGITALLAALMAVQQNDIKRILAYSTLSQLGYMVMSVGLSGPAPAMFHLTTHAFFKALLFLGAGSVIYAVHHEQDIWRMGGLREKLPVTYWTFLLGTLALCGLPPFSGFYSKDAILGNAWHHNTSLFIIGVLVAILTTFYMFRLIFVAFLGSSRSEASSHAHESPRIMTWPLIALAVPTVIGGIIGIEQFVGKNLGVIDESHVSFIDQFTEPFSHAPLAAIAGLGAVLFGGLLAYALYANAPRDPLPGMIGWFARAMRNRFYFDEFYDWLIARTQGALSNLAQMIDQWIIGGLFIKGIHGTTEFAGRALRLAQSGSLQTYSFLFAAGAALLLFLFFKT